jgi:hypothetical protein
VKMILDHIKSGHVNFERIMDDITKIQRSANAFGEDGKMREKELALNNVEGQGANKPKCPVKDFNGYHKKVDCPKFKAEKGKEEVQWMWQGGD